MDQVKLPIAESPIVGLHYHAYPLSVVLWYKEYWPWFYSHYIQVYGVKDFSQVWGSPWFNFASFDIWNYGIPYISDNHILDQRMIKENNIDVILLIINYLDRGWYTYAEIDDFFIPFRESYLKSREPHDIFIFGYDLKQKSFETAGFNNQKEFAHEKLSFSDFEKAFCNNNSTMSEENLGARFIRFFRVIEGLDCEFDLKLVTESINDYLKSVDTMEKFRMYRTPPQGRAYGMETYYYLKKYTEFIVEKRLKLDIRPIHLFWEHKKCMSLRLKYMCENNYLESLKSVCEDYKEIEDKALSARIHMIKYGLTNNSKSLEKVINILENIENMERELLALVLAKLRKCNRL